MGKFLGSTALEYLWEQIKYYIASKKYAGGTADGGTALRAAGIPFAYVDSTSTSTVYTATVPGITALTDGVCCYLVNNVVKSAAGFTININNLGALPAYSTQAAATALTTGFGKGYTYLFVYNSTRVEGGCWDCYYGYSSSIGYAIRTNSALRPTKSKFYRYRILFSSPDGTQWIPSNTSSSTNATSSRTVNQDKIDPWGEIRYYNATTAIDANSTPGATSLYQQYTLTLGYSFNRTGAALVLTYPGNIYIKCAPQSDGSAIIDSTTPYVQSLPSTEDGKIYIFLGMAYSATSIEMLAYHPVYYYKGGAIRLWTNAAETDISGKANTADLADVAFSGSYNDLDGTPTIPTVPTNVSAFNNDAGYLTSYTETDPTVPSWAKQSTKPSYTAQEVGALPSSTIIPTKVSDLTNDSGFTTNTGTITGITMNGASKGTSGVVNLGTVLTEHQDISGKQDAITTVNVSVDTNTGTPSGSASFSGGTLNLSFSNLKGAKGDTGEAGATGPQGQTGPQGPKGDTGVSGDASDLAVIHSVDQTTTYDDTDVAGADAVQTTDKNLIDDEYALFGIFENIYKTKAEKDEIPDTEGMELITATAIIDVKERIVRKASCHQITISSRPTNPTVGEHYYDTTIHKPIWWSGTNWTDALGNNV